MELRDADGETISLKVTSQNSAKAYTEIGLETEEVEQWERGTRMDGKVDQEVQTELLESAADLSEVNLTDFLKKTLPRVLKALESRSSTIQYYDPNWDDEGDSTETLHLFPGPQIEESLQNTSKGEDYFEEGEKVVSFNLRVGATAWNCRGTVLAAGYTRQIHGGWCAHRSYVWVWYVTRGEEKPVQFEVEGCVTSLCFHPQIPALLHVGTFNGQINVLDIGKADPFLGTTPVDEYFHREAVNQLLWLEPVASSPQLFSVSSDGKILHWEEKTRYPLRGFMIQQGEGGLCFCSLSDDFATILVGTESGQVLKASLPDLQTAKLPLEGMKWKPEAELILNNAKSRHEVKSVTERYALDTNKKEIDPSHIFASKPDLRKFYASPFTFVYEVHDGPVTGVSASPFMRNLFATCSSDGTVRIYHVLMAKARIVIEPGELWGLTSVAWSASRPMVLFVGAGEGSVFVYDLGESVSRWSTQLRFEERNSVVRISTNKSNRSLLAIGYSSGQVRVVRLGKQYCALQADELRKLATMANLGCVQDCRNS